MKWRIIASISLLLFGAGLVVFFTKRDNTQLQLVSLRADEASEGEARIVKYVRELGSEAISPDFYVNTNGGGGQSGKNFEVLTINDFFWQGDVEVEQLQGLIVQLNQSQVLLQWLERGR